MRRRTATSPTGRPRISASPLVGNTSCISSFSVVVLPAPLGPRKPKTSPGATSSDSAIERAVRARPPETDLVVLGELARADRGLHD